MYSPTDAYELSIELANDRDALESNDVCKVWLNFHVRKRPEIPESQGLDIGTNELLILSPIYRQQASPMTPIRIQDSHSPHALFEP